MLLGRFPREAPTRSVVLSRQSSSTLLVVVAHTFVIVLQLLASRIQVSQATTPTANVVVGHQQQQQQQQSIAGLQQSLAQLLQVFNGNESQQLEWNHFKLMEKEGDFLLLGAR